jgi:hypothetical protein
LKGPSLRREHPNPAANPSPEASMLAAVIRWMGKPPKAEKMRVQRL